MAISKFPFEFTSLKGSSIWVTTKDRSSFFFRIKTSKGDVEEFQWTPTSHAYSTNTVEKEEGWSKEVHHAVQGFWSIYND